MTYEVYINVRHHPRHCDEWEEKESTAFKLADYDHPLRMVANCLRDFADEIEAKAPPEAA